MSYKDIDNIKRRVANRHNISVGHPLVVKRTKFSNQSISNSESSKYNFGSASNRKVKVSLPKMKFMEKE